MAFYICAVSLVLYKVRHRSINGIEGGSDSTSDHDDAPQSMVLSTITTVNRELTLIGHHVH
jgi:hypothetical protein